MVKPDDILISAQRSEQARASDKLMEQLVAQRQRLFGATFLLIILAEMRQSDGELLFDARQHSMTAST